MRLGAGFDPAASNNAAALVIVGEVSPDLWRPLAIKSWQGRPEKPLDLRLNVGLEAGEIVKSFGLTSWMSDVFAWHDVRLVSDEMGLLARKDEASLETSFGPVRRMLNRALLGGDGPRLALRSDDSEIDDRCALIAKQLGRVTSKRRAGSLEILMGEDGASHGDEARALIRALWHARAGEERRGFDPSAWGEANAQFRSSRAVQPHPIPSPQHETLELFRHPRAR